MVEIKLREAMEAYRARTGQRLTYDGLSKKTGLSRATIEALGSRSNYNTTLATIDRLCTALECSVGELLEYSPPTD